MVKARTDRTNQVRWLRAGRWCIVLVFAAATVPIVWAASHLAYSIKLEQVRTCDRLRATVLTLSLVYVAQVHFARSYFAHTLLTRV